jgi:hypothetical protein
LGSGTNGVVYCKAKLASLGIGILHMPKQEQQESLSRVSNHFN